MRKNFGLKLIISSLIILLPMFFGLIFWNNVPEYLTTHWGFDGQADGWSGRGMAVFGLPLILLAFHWLCLFITLRVDPKNRESDSKALGLIFWLIPLVSLFASALVWATAFGREFDQSLFMSLLFGVLFIVIGNYLPKCRQNYTMGIKVPWALNNEENWNATHRFGGRLWVIGGVVMLFGALLPESAAVWLLLADVLVMALVPTLYSYFYYKKQLAAGSATAADASFVPRGLSKKTSYISLAVLALVLIGTAVLMFTGDIQYRFGEDSFTVEADFYGDLSVAYSAVESVEYMEDAPGAMRVMGFGSGRLHMGMFENEEFGSHTRYCYTRNDAAVVLSVEGRTLVLNAIDEAGTRALYENLLVLTGVED